MKPLIQDVYGVQVLLGAQATVVGHWAVTDVHKKIVVVHLTLAANERIANEFTQAAKRVNPNLTFELIGTKIGTVDFRPMALEIASKKNDALPPSLDTQAVRESCVKGPCRPPLCLRMGVEWCFARRPVGLVHYGAWPVKGQRRNCRVV